MKITFSFYVINFQEDTAIEEFNGDIQKLYIYLPTTKWQMWVLGKLSPSQNVQISEKAC